MRLSLATLTAPVKTGFRELWSHKLRSLLTMLGIIFGVAAVIAMVSIGEGAAPRWRGTCRTKPPRGRPSA